MPTARRAQESGSWGHSWLAGCDFNRHGRFGHLRSAAFYARQTALMRGILAGSEPNSFDAIQPGLPSLQQLGQERPNSFLS